GAQDAQTLRSLTRLPRVQFGQNLPLEYFERHTMTEETGFPVQNLFEQPFPLCIRGLQPANEVRNRIQAPRLKVGTDLRHKHVLWTVQQNSGLTLHQQAQLGKLMFEHQMEALLPLARPPDIESCTHSDSKCCGKPSTLSPTPSSTLIIGTSQMKMSFAKASR